MHLFIGMAFASDGNDWLTYYEKSGFLETPRYAQTIEFCRRLDNESKFVKFTDFGLSPQGRQLPLLIVDGKGKFEPEDISRRKLPVILIMACIHAGESDGKDAGFQLIRDIIINKKYQNVLDKTVILFIPIFNVDGHERFGPYNRINQNGPKEMGWRVTAQNLNLNRDFLKADCPEMRSWLKLFSTWLPDFLIDCHVTDGADYPYVISYAIENRQNMAEPVRQWINTNYLPNLEKRMETCGFPLIPYIGFKDGFDISKGAMSWVTPPRFSHGYGAVQSRSFLLVETHMLKDYRTRVASTYQILLHTLEIISGDAQTLLNANRDADRITSNLAGSDFALRYKMNEDTTWLDFNGYESEVINSEISGGKWIQWTQIPKQSRIPWFNSADPANWTRIPYAYIIPPEWGELIDGLELHGVTIERLKHEVPLEVDSYKFKNVSWQNDSYEGRHPLKFGIDLVSETRTFPVGSAVVICNQRTNRIIAQLLEPEGYDSFVSWGFLDAIFEQKEYAEDYVLESLSRQMLKDRPELEKEFKEMTAKDSSFAVSPSKRLDFFYQRSPHWDSKINLYPIGKLTNFQELPLE